MLRLIRMEEIRFIFSLEILSLMMKLTLMILSHLHWIFNVMILLLLDTILVQSLISRIYMSRYIQNQTFNLQFNETSRLDFLLQTDFIRHRIKHLWPYGRNRAEIGRNTDDDFWKGTSLLSLSTGITGILKLQ